MTKVFLKEVELKNGGYLYSKDDQPVNNDAFVIAQKHAEYIVTFAEKAKDKDFVGKKADNLEAFTKGIKAQLSATEVVKFIDTPEEIKKPTMKKLADEALAFIGFTEETSKVDKINTFMQQFVVLHDFETNGLFFDQGIVKLNKVYTVAEITAAVKEVIELI